MRKPLLHLALVALAAVPAYASTSTVIDCAFSNAPNQILTRGIVVPDYPGNNIRTVQLRFAANVIGTYQLTLEVHRGAFDGPLVGAPATVNVALTPAATPVFFDFGAAPVSRGDTLALVQRVSGPGAVMFDGGMGALPTDPQPPTTPDEAYETTDTTAPLSTYLKNQAGITIQQDDLGSTGCVPTDSVLCLDRNPGDRRFQVSLSYASDRSGGISGAGQALPTKSLGTTRGGLFWFFGPDNPEMLVKVLDGCGVNNSFWVFYSAGTDLGFNLTVLDTATGRSKTYSNVDKTAAASVQDTSAFPCQ